MGPSAYFYVQIIWLLSFSSYFRLNDSYFFSYHLCMSDPKNLSIIR